MHNLTELVAILACFGTPVALILGVMYMRQRGKQLALLAARGGEPSALEAAQREKRMLEARIQNLETIVCSVDFELNQRLNRIAAGASGAMPALGPGPGPRSPSSVPPPSGFEATVATHTARPSEQFYALGQLEPGRVVLGRYHIERELGRGGMGAVYLATDSKLGERVALKVISSAMAGDPAQAVARFHREVQAARRVTHPNVIRIHDLGEEGPLLFLSMEYIEGETLAARVKRLGALPVSEAAGILGDVALGVAAAHEVGVVHRDLKPQNVLLASGPAGTPLGRSVKVIDFGLATTSFFAGMTATGMILGTPEYMAPEQIRGGACDSRTDVYALGAMAYHAVCGRPPFQGETPIAVGFGHLNETPRPPRQIRAEVPEALEAAILRAMAKDPKDRFADAAEWRKAFVSPPS